jgi:hypothetical protein
MKKQILSEEFLRMQKLAGIITESLYEYDDEGSGYNYDEEESGYSNVEYKEGPGASEEEIQKAIAHYRKNPVIWKMASKSDFEGMAQGEGGTIKADYYPTWKKTDFETVLSALEDLK